MDGDKYIIEVEGEETITVIGFKKAIYTFLTHIRHCVNSHEQVFNEDGVFRVGAAHYGRMIELSATDEEIIFHERLSYLLTNFHWDIGDQTDKDMAWIKKSYLIHPFEIEGQRYAYSITRSENEIKVDLDYDVDGHFSSNAFAFIDPNKEYYFILDDEVVIGGLESNELPLGTKINYSIRMKKAK